jgi:hypothetical protein
MQLVTMAANVMEIHGDVALQGAMALMRQLGATAAAALAPVLPSAGEGELESDGPPAALAGAPEAEGKIHRVDPKFASRPTILTKNLCKSLRVDLYSGSIL